MTSDKGSALRRFFEDRGVPAFMDLETAIKALVVAAHCAEIRSSLNHEQDTPWQQRASRR